MLLIEIFNTNINSTIVKSTDNEFVATFTINELIYTVEFKEYEEGGWEVRFEQRESKDSKWYSKNKPTYRATNNTGTSTFKIFSQILNIVEEFLSTHQIKKLLLAANTKEPSRIKIYDRLVDTLTKRYNYQYKIDFYKMFKMYIVQIK